MQVLDLPNILVLEENMVSSLIPRTPKALGYEKRISTCVSQQKSNLRKEKEIAKSMRLLLPAKKG